jgi:hypothetical protein
VCHNLLSDLAGLRRAPPPPPPSRTNWTRLVPPSVLTGRVASLLPYRGLGALEQLLARGNRLHRVGDGLEVRAAVLRRTAALHSGSPVLCETVQSAFLILSYLI